MVIQQCGKTPMSHTGLGKRTSPHLLQYRMSSASLPFSALASSVNAEKRTTEENSLHNSHKILKTMIGTKLAISSFPLEKKARRIEVNRSIHKMDHSKGCNFKENHSKGCRISKKILIYFSYSRSMNPRKLLKMLYQRH